MITDLWNNFRTYFTKGWAAFCAVIVFLTGLIGGSNITNSPEVKLVSTDKIVLEKSLCSSQGITTDGEFYYTSGAMAAVGINGLAKWTVDGYERVCVNFMAIPSKYVEEYGSNHIGGISYYDGKIYASVEDKSDSHPMVLVYDAETLKYTGTAYELSKELLPTGIPWCAVDAENGYLYASQFRDIDYILAFNLDDMSFSHKIMLSQRVTRIQGCEVYNGKLYMSYDAKDSADEEVLSADVRTGEVATVFTRHVSQVDNEAEGITVYPMKDGSLYHILDYDKTVAVNVRHYAPEV